MTPRTALYTLLLCLPGCGAVYIPYEFEVSEIRVDGVVEPVWDFPGWQEPFYMQLTDGFDCEMNLVGPSRDTLVFALHEDPCP